MRASHTHRSPRRALSPPPAPSRSAAPDERADTRAWLHDHTLQMLEFIASGAYDDEVTVARLRHVAALAADELREWLEDSAAAPPTDLACALRREIAEVQLLAGALTIELDGADAVTGLTPDQVVAIAGATREALHNARKHARGTRVRVTCAATPSGAEVTVADDGVGFRPDATPRRLGLRRSVVARMLAVGGSARVVSHPGHGTLVVLTAGSPPPRPLPQGLAA